MNVKEIAEKAKLAAEAYKNTPTEIKNKLLGKIADRLEESAEKLIVANRLDLFIARENGRNEAFIDRLTLTKERVGQMAEGLRSLIALNDPVGETVSEYVLPNGLEVKKVRAPLGVVGIIYEARPNVTADAAGLTLKSGNAVILRGSRESVNSNIGIVTVMRSVLTEEGINPDVVSFLDSKSREATAEMLELDQLIDVVIPRGGNGLKDFVRKNAKMPVIASAGGNCHVYVHQNADFETAYRILENAKVQRPSVCNAAETLLVDRSVAKEFLPQALKKLSEKGVELRGTPEVNEIYPVKIVPNEEFYEEYENLILKIALVDGAEEAVRFINKYGTGHSEAIVTKDAKAAEYFLSEVDAAAVYHNASTRFTDGFELGLGAEMGISTQKLHCRGPVGLVELTAANYRVTGSGQIRE